jgi:hypothetical protein
MDTIITSIVKKAVESLTSFQFTFIEGNADELNLKLDNEELPVFGMEENFAFDLIGQNIGYKTKYNLVLYILFKSSLPLQAEQREDAYRNSEIALREFLSNLNLLGYDKTSQEFVINPVNHDFFSGTKVISEISGVRGLRAKNLFDANTDGLMLSNFQITLYDKFEKCLNDFIL